MVLKFLVSLVNRTLIMVDNYIKIKKEGSGLNLKDGIDLSLLPLRMQENKNMNLIEYFLEVASRKEIKENNVLEQMS